MKHIEKLLRFRKSTKNHDGRPPNNASHTLSCLYFIKAAKATYFAWAGAQKSSLFIKFVGTDVLESRTFVVVTALGLLHKGETSNVRFETKSTSQPGVVHMHLTCFLPIPRIERVRYVCKSEQNDRYKKRTELLRLKANVDLMLTHQQWNAVCCLLHTKVCFKNLANLLSRNVIFKCRIFMRKKGFKINVFHEQLKLAHLQQIDKTDYFWNSLTLETIRLTFVRIRTHSVLWTKTYT